MFQHQQIILKNALNDFKSFNELEFNDLVPMKKSTCSHFNSKLTHYILVDNKLHSLYDDEIKMRSVMMNLTGNVWSGTITNGAVLKVEKKILTPTSCKINRLLKTVIGSLAYYTDLIYDIGCVEETGEEEEDSESDEEIFTNQEKLQSNYFKAIDHERGLVKLIKLANPALMTNHGNWTISNIKDWTLVQDTYSDNFEFSWLINGVEHWVMSCKNVGGSIHEFKRNLGERLV